jgi:mannose-6-phosphate isomerase
VVEVIRGALKDYAWGVPDGLVAWSGERTGAPQAELWFGAHPGAPSPLVGQPVTLDAVLSPNEVPLLTKLLAAAQPLSIQVHPDAQLAKVSFERQVQPGSDQVYSDANEKTELLVAIEEFEVFAGWRDRKQALAILAQIDGTELARSILETDGPIAAIPALRAIDHEGRGEQLVAALRALGMNASEVDAYGTVAQLYRSDPGLLVAVLLQYRALAPGNAIFVPAGVPHSYIRGLGLEVMTSSDNVVRLGLTPKPVFVEAALAALTNSADEVIFTSEFGERISPAGAPFAATITSNETQLESGAFRLVLALEGEASVRAHGGGATISLQQGEAAVLSAEEPAVLVSSAGVVAVVEHLPR